MRNFIVSLFYCFIVSLLLVSPVWAQPIPCEVDIGGECCSSVDTCFGTNYGNQGCPGERPICCDSCTSPEEGGIFNPVIGLLGRQPGQTTIGYLVAAFIRIAYMFGSLLVLIYFIWGAVEWLTSGGEPEGIKRAQSRITNALVGLFLLAGTYLVAVILGEILKIDLLEIVLPSPIK